MQDALSARRDAVTGQQRTRLAWFTPLEPVRSGISRYSAELLPPLARWYDVDVFDVARAHDFVWQHFRDPYDLIVYQLGNADCHEYMWPYVMRYPGLTVLHDAQLHQSRAAALLKRRRRADDYRAEFAFNHPDADPGIAELVVHGFGGDLLHFWPLVRAVVTSARAVAVHAERVADDLREQFPAACIETIPMGVPPPRRTTTAGAVRERLGIAPDEVVFAAVGRITPEKRIGPALRALAALQDGHPAVRLLLVGDTAAYYDAEADAAGCGVRERTIVAGYVDEALLDAAIDAADVCLCLRWPTNGETSASWLRCLAAGKPTVITDLVHLAHVPSIDPRTWAPVPDAHGAPPVTVSIDILDEDHSLALAMRRLAGDAALRRTLGQRAREYWEAHHTLDRMVAAYRRVISVAMARTAPPPDLPAHLTTTGAELAEQIVAGFAIEIDWLGAARTRTLG